jgi:hypothetical protein
MSSASSNVSDNAWSEHDLRDRSSRCNFIDAGTARSAADFRFSRFGGNAAKLSHQRPFRQGAVFRSALRNAIVHRGVPP